MGKEIYISLIAKQLSNELNSAELRELNLWLSGNSNNVGVLNDFKNVWDSVSSYKASTQFDTDAAFSKFSEKYDLSSDTSTNTNSVPKSSQNNYTKIALMALVALCLFLGGYFLSQRLTPTFENNTMASLPIALNDNIRATLKPNTSLKYDQASNSISSLNGGGYFEVNALDNINNGSSDNKPSKKLTFKLKNTEINTSNASLSIDNYEGEDITAQVKEGTVSYTHNNSTKQLSKGQKLIISNDNGSHSVIETADDSGFDWQKGILSFDDTPLSEVFTRIEKFYGVDIIVKDNPDTKVHFTAANLKPSSLDECLQLLKSSIAMDISRDKNRVYITNIKAK